MASASVLDSFVYADRSAAAYRRASGAPLRFSPQLQGVTDHVDYARRSIDHGTEPREWQDHSGKARGSPGEHPRPGRGAGGGLHSTLPPRGGLPTTPSLVSPFPAEVERGRFCLRGGRGQRTAPADVSVVAGLRVWGHGVGMGPGLWLSLSPLT